MEVTERPGIHVEGKPEVRFIGGIHGNHVVGKELLVQLLWSLCSRYNDDYATTQVIE